MSILDLPVDVIALIALDLDLPNILSLCESNVKFNRAVCKKESFWLNKLLKDFPDYKKLKDDRNYRETYKLLYNLTILKEKLNLDETIYETYERKTLNLGSGWLKEIPKELGNLHNLQELHMDDNKISIIPKELGNLHNLQVLDLDDNKISIIPKELANIPKLHELYLYDNPIKEIPEELEHLVYLD